ncbi:hypothetical protein [Enterococcus sp. CSURQ0835]|uniref:hypothetical protein n=1 Tax=Enterococcus sp. CSURQ0835 TaxID=2681394 RepID=UPI00135AC1CC|nr:hypothetical protein [Enterococcus sp. CSURQ0835]
MKTIIKNWTFLVLGLMTAALGAYLATHRGYLDQVYTYSELFDWFDSPLGGLILVGIGGLTGVGIWLNSPIVRRVALILNGSVYAMFFASFALRALAGFHNLSWIFSLAAFINVLGTAYKEATRVHESE